MQYLPRVFVVVSILLSVSCGESGEERAAEPEEVLARPEAAAQTTPVPPPSPVSAAELGNEVQVHVSGFRSNEGKVGCALFTSELGFPQDANAAHAAQWCAVTHGSAVCDFADVPLGSCAVVCYHDENNDDALAVGLYGVPLEGIAASNDALCIMGPPRYADAQWSYAGGLEVLQLHMTYNVGKQR